MKFSWFFLIVNVNTEIRRKVIPDGAAWVAVRQFSECLCYWIEAFWKCSYPVCKSVTWNPYKGFCSWYVQINKPVTWLCVYFSQWLWKLYLRNIIYPMFILYLSSFEVRCDWKLIIRSSLPAFYARWVTGLARSLSLFLWVIARFPIWVEHSEIIQGLFNLPWVCNCQFVVDWTFAWVNLILTCLVSQEFSFMFARKKILYRFHFIFVLCYVS